MSVDEAFAPASDYIEEALRLHLRFAEASHQAMQQAPKPELRQEWDEQIGRMRLLADLSRQTIPSHVRTSAGTVIYCTRHVFDMAIVACFNALNQEDKITHRTVFPWAQRTKEQYKARRSSMRIDRRLWPILGKHYPYEVPDLSSWHRVIFHIAKLANKKHSVGVLAEPRASYDSAQLATLGQDIQQGRGWESTSKTFEVFTFRGNFKLESLSLTRFLVIDDPVFDRPIGAFNWTYDFIKAATNVTNDLRAECKRIMGEK